MLTLENEYYIRLILLILRGGTLVLRQILLKKLEDRNLQLNGFLQINRETINRLKSDNVLTLKQYHSLFPNNGTIPDMCKFDISLLSCLLLNMFTPSMSKTEEKAIENIRTLRNDFTAHHPDGCIDARKFFRKWNQLSTSIMNLGNQLSSEQSSALAKMIRCTGDDSIDISHAIQDIKDATSTTDQFLEHVSRQLEHLSLTVQRLSTCQEDTREEIKKLEVELKTVIENGNSDISTVIVGEVSVSGRNPEAVTAAAATLIDHAKRSKGYISRLQEALQSGREGIMNRMSTAFAYVKGYFWKTDFPLTQNEESESQARVTSLVQDIYDAGGEVIDVTEGSMLLHIRCQSVAVMLAVLEYFRSSVLEQRLNDIEKCLTEESRCKIILTASIQIKSLREALHTIQEKQTSEFTKTVRFSIKCQNAEGVLNVFNVFEGNSGSDNISKLAEGLSFEVGAPVTLRTSVDKDTVRQFIGYALKRNEYRGSSKRQMDPPLKERLDDLPLLEELSVEEKYRNKLDDLPLLSVEEKYRNRLGVSAVGMHDYKATGSFHKEVHGFATPTDYERDIKNLETGGSGYRFITVLLYPENRGPLPYSVFDELDKTLQSLTGTLNIRPVTLDYYRSQVVIVYLTGMKFKDRYILNRADGLEREIIPMFLEENEEIAMYLLKELRNLSKVRIVLKTENGNYISKRPLREVCTDILEIAAARSRQKFTFL